ncbi:MAG: hypothetical protein HHAS10_05710 [Candidatus Altimarinota bacterium]
MHKIIHARNYIEASQLPNEIKEFLYVNSVAVNRLSTPFDVPNLLKLLQKYGLRIKQIVVAYEVPPGFTRSGQYFSDSGCDVDSVQGGVVDTYSPGFYGLSRAYDGCFKIILFMRKDIFHILRQKNRAYIKGAYHLYKMIEDLLSDEERRNMDPLAFVGVLPGKIIEWGVAGLGEEYQELIDMAEATNRNSARFVAEATKRVLEEYNFTKESLLVLGSHGALGRQIVHSFSGNIQGFDIKKDTCGDTKKILEHASVILDCTNGDSLKKDYHDGCFQLGRRYIWIVESYPVPEYTTVSALIRSGIDIRVLHVRGVAEGNGFDGGNIIPFPIYGHIMPCCTGSLNQPASDVVVEDLYSETEFCNS